MLLLPELCLLGNKNKHISWSNMAMDNRSIAAFIETNRTRTNSVIICLPSKGAGREKRHKQWHLRCIAAPPQARAAARKKYISPAIQQAINTNQSIKTESYIVRWCPSRPCKHGTAKLLSRATKTQIIQRVTQIWKLILKKPPMQAESGVNYGKTRRTLSDNAARASEVRELVIWNKWL